MTRGSSLVVALTTVVCTSPRDDAPPQKVAEFHGVFRGVPTFTGSKNVMLEDKTS